MKLKLIRKEFTPRTTIGDFLVDEVFECYSLEDVVREVGVKVPGKTAIPEGVYNVALTFSNRFQRVLPVLIGVPSFTDILIHSGNTEADTEGCLLVGQTKAENFIGNSRAAFKVFFPKIKAALEVEKVKIEVTS